MWALGCILFELMALRSPWLDPSDPSRISLPILVKRIREARPRYAFLRSEYSEHLIELTRWMLCSAPSRRASAVDIMTHLEMRAPPSCSSFESFASIVQGDLAVSDISPRVSSLMASMTAEEEAAVRLIQQSFRRSTRDVPMERRASLPLQRSPVATARRITADPPDVAVPAVTAARVADSVEKPVTTAAGREATRRSAALIQQRFRASFAKRGPQPPQTRLERLATPRNAPATRFPPTSRRVAVAPSAKKQPPIPRVAMPTGVPRPAWV
jgi:serine/threonine protein kinase